MNKKGNLIIFFGFFVFLSKVVFSNGFNRIFNARHSYGKGDYFATNANYSIDFSDEHQSPDGNTYKYLQKTKTTTKTLVD